MQPNCMYKPAMMLEDHARAGHLRAPKGSA
jgi:hypothetical protein